MDQNRGYFGHEVDWITGRVGVAEQNLFCNSLEIPAEMNRTERSFSDSCSMLTVTLEAIPTHDELAGKPLDKLTSLHIGRDETPIVS